MASWNEKHIAIIKVLSSGPYAVYVAGDIQRTSDLNLKLV